LVEKIQGIAGASLREFIVFRVLFFLKSALVWTPLQLFASNAKILDGLHPAALGWFQLDFGLSILDL
jgi:hypothetical protein